MAENSESSIAAQVQKLTDKISKAISKLKGGEGNSDEVLHSLEDAQKEIATLQKSIPSGKSEEPLPVIIPEIKKNSEQDLASKSSVIRKVHAQDELMRALQTARQRHEAIFATARVSQVRPIEKPVEKPFEKPAEQVAEKVAEKVATLEKPKEVDPGTVTMIVQPVQKFELRQRALMAVNNEKSLPVLSAAAQKLAILTQQSNITFKDVADIVKLDPGLTSRCFQLANSKSNNKPGATTVSGALLQLGFAEIRKLAACIDVVDGLSNLKSKVNWDLFWLHSILTARLTEILSNAYQLKPGKGYVAGLMHDVGKIIIANNFPKEFDYLLQRFSHTKNTLYQTEQEIFDITHPEIGAELCGRFHIEPEVVMAIRHHHEPAALMERTGPESGFLALCICIADSLANLREANIQGGSKSTERNLEKTPEWALLQQFTPKIELKMDVELELSKAKETLSLIKESHKCGPQ
jgi:putative nucleotidyltransferase with HDIG domain